jgi:ABC-type antimicrobial peptide transport system permease subunit
VRAIALAEGALLGIIGGLLGIILAKPMLTGFGKALSGLGFLTGVGFKMPTAALTLFCAAAIGAIASAVPAWTAGRMSIVDALRRQE